MEIFRSLDSLLNTAHRQAESVISLAEKAQCQVELESEVVRVPHQQASSHVSTLRVVFALVVGLGKVEGEGMVFGEPIVACQGPLQAQKLHEVC